ncbi:MAG: tetratricopeptide repeat protein [Candidatus Omnitrophica bacterium]|nr:tetratricopeptide repeat protein [Candidatus Omnitrophota bacterium]
MRNILATTFLVTAFCAAGLADSKASLFEEAGAKYHAGEFKKAEALYEELSETRPTAAVHYNLGNASFRAGHKGRALVHYRRAQRLAPRDRDLLWNVGILKGTLVDRFERRGEAVELVAMNELVWAFTAGSAALAGVCLLAFLFPPLRPGTRPVAALLMLCLLGLSALLAFKWTNEKDPRAVVLDREVFARYGPSDRESKAFALHEGAEGRVLDRSRDWIYLGLADGKTGWVPETACEIV